MNGSTFLQLIEQGGVVMYPLLLCSVVSVGLVIERLWGLARAGRAVRGLRAQVLAALREGGVTEAAAVCRTSSTPFANVLRTAVTGQGKDPEGVERTMRRQMNEVARQLRGHIWLIGTIGSLAPFIGLFGTVLGIIRSFEDMAVAGSGGFAVVAAGISEALIATAGGLLVGVLSIFAYNAFSVRINDTAARMRDTADEVLQRVAEAPPREGGIARVAQSV